MQSEFFWNPFVRTDLNALEKRDPRVQSWLDALDARHLSDLTPPEVARALRALSSCYVERRADLATGGALGSAGKRAAFSLFYAPLHFFTVERICEALALDRTAVSTITDLGCGTGVAGAAWALHATAASVSGFDRHPWAIREANWTFRQLAIKGRAVQQDLARVRLPGEPAAGIVAAYTINELPAPLRDLLRQRLLAAHGVGASILIVEPIARGVTPWWHGWEAAFLDAGGRTDEWRFPAVLPPRQRGLATAAGLAPRELTARSLFAGPRRAT